MSPGRLHFREKQNRLWNDSADKGESETACMCRMLRCQQTARGLAADVAIWPRSSEVSLTEVTLALYNTNFSIEITF
jgi:hypothetical protein